MLIMSYALSFVTSFYYLWFPFLCDKDGNVSGEDYENIDWDTEDELEIENIAPPSCSNVVARNVETIVTNGQVNDLDY